jgi:hypothetical protein
MITDDANGRIPCLSTRSGRMEGIAAPRPDGPPDPLCYEERHKSTLWEDMIDRQ